jgi:hypothetical protein
VGRREIFPVAGRPEELTIDRAIEMSPDSDGEGIVNVLDGCPTPTRRTARVKWRCRNRSGHAVTVTDLAMLSDLVRAPPQASPDVVGRVFGGRSIVCRRKAWPWRLTAERETVCDRCPARLPVMVGPEESGLT